MKDPFVLSEAMHFADNPEFTSPATTGAGYDLLELASYVASLAGLPCPNLNTNHALSLQERMPHGSNGDDDDDDTPTDSDEQEPPPDPERFDDEWPFPESPRYPTDDK